MSIDTSLQQFMLPTFSNGKSQGNSSNPYLACLIDPANNAVRIPDEYSNQTALYCSRSFYDVYGNTGVGTASSDIGKFSFMIRPVLGAQSPPPALAQVTNVSNTAVWPTTDFSSVLTYQSYADPNLNTLIGNLGSNGLVREIRPVAMSAWFQYTVPQITLGGHVACALTDGNVQNYFPNPPNMAGLPLQEYRTLSTLPNSYNGKIIDGCYAFYKPFDAEDIVFQNAHEPYQSYSDYGVAHTYPAIIISGQVMSTSGTYAGVIGRIQVDIIFEYVTFSRVVESTPSPVNPPLLWNARQALQNVRTCMANDEHESFFRKVLNVGKTLLGKVAPIAGTTLGTIIGGPGGAAIGRSLGNAVASAVGPKPKNGSSVPTQGKVPKQIQVKRQTRKIKRKPQRLVNNN
jgi:hypothetical protein